MGALLDSVRARLFGQPELQQTGVADELRGAGTAFAALIEGVGKAVADTQRELDATAGHIATDMATTEVETVQAVVSNYDNSGNLQGVDVVTGRTSALSIAVPPALSFKRVHLEGSFVASEFSATSTSNVNVNLVGVAAGRGLGASVVNANTNTQSEQTQDVSVATMSMTAQITPKLVKALPKPPLIFKGPSLAVSIDSISPHPEIINQVPAPPPATDPPYLERRSAVVKIQLTDIDGNVTSTTHSKTIALDCGALDWGVTSSAGADVAAGPITDGNGLFYIKVSRIATASTEPKKDFVIRGSLNLVNATCSVSL